LNTDEATIHFISPISAKLIFYSPDELCGTARHERANPLLPRCFFASRLPNVKDAVGFKPANGVVWRIIHRSHTARR